MVRVFLTLTLLLFAGCSSDTVQSLGGPIDLGESSSIELDAPLRTTGLFHQICFALPPGYAVTEDFRGVVGPSGRPFAVHVRAKAQSGRKFDLDRLSTLRTPELDLVCLSSPELVGRQSEALTDIEVLSSAAWSTPEVRWLSVENL